MVKHPSILFSLPLFLAPAILVFARKLNEWGARLPLKRKAKKQHHVCDAVALLEGSDVYEVPIPRRDDAALSFREPAKWLRENVGIQGIKWDMKIRVDDPKIYVILFIDEADAMAFKIAWSAG